MLSFQLSVEDLSQCKAPNGQTCFAGLQSIKSKQYLPSVEDPSPIIEAWAGNDLIEVNLRSDSNFRELLNYQKGKYIFVNFGDDYQNETKSVKLTRHDKMITTLYTELLRNTSNIMVIYTGKQATHQKRVVREIFSPFDGTGESNVTDSTNGTSKVDVPIKEVEIGDIWKTDEALLYYVSMNIKEGLSEKHSMNVTNVTTWFKYQVLKDLKLTSNTTKYNETYVDIYDMAATNESASNGTNESASNETVVSVIEIIKNQIVVSISVNVFSMISDNDSKTSNYTEEFLEFVITLKYGYWWADQFTWKNETLFSQRKISAAEGFSFHCTPEIRLTNRNHRVDITWNGLQLQPNFNGVEGQIMKSFGHAYDCVGFVSPVILSGLLVTFMLLFILFIGILCIMDIKPINRFDNPKGKTLTITIDE